MKARNYIKYLQEFGYYVYKKSALKGCSFNIGDYDELACDTKRGIWYFTTGSAYYYGPFKSRQAARRAYENATPRERH